MLALRGLARTSMAIAVLIGAQSAQSRSVGPMNHPEDLSGVVLTTAAGTDYAPPRAQQHPSTLSRSLDASQFETSVGGDRGLTKAIRRPESSVSGLQRFCQNLQATAGVPAPHQTGPSDLSYLERARSLVKSNDIAAARLIFTRLANNGVAEAAFELGRTYDPDFLRTIPVAGLEPDREVAWQWYKRAAALGNADAKNRLAKLKIDTRQ